MKAWKKTRSFFNTSFTVAFPALLVCCFLCIMKEWQHHVSTMQKRREHEQAAGKHSWILSFTMLKILVPVFSIWWKFDRQSLTFTQQKSMQVVLAGEEVGSGWNYTASMTKSWQRKSGKELEGNCVGLEPILVLHQDFRIREIFFLLYISFKVFESQYSISPSLVSEPMLSFTIFGYIII